jgi:phospholipid/cholesterol/gamma-HCH transport system permease protein
MALDSSRGAASPRSGSPWSLVARAFEPLTHGLEGLGRVVRLTFDTLRWLARPPFRIGQMLIAMEFIGVQSLFIIMLTGTFSGMVFALQSVNSLREYGAEGVVGSVVAISLTREIAPVFSALMITARAGSAIAAELGNMRVTEQIDALTTMAVSPVQYLLSPRLLAGALMFPLLCIVYSSVGMIGAWFVAVKGMGIDPGVFISNIEEYMVPGDFWMGEIKGVCFGFLVTAICGEQGFFASGGARGVGQATTRAVVRSAVAILIANYIITSALTNA